MKKHGLKDFSSDELIDECFVYKVVVVINVIKMSADHNCLVCEGGSKLHGFNLTCRFCLVPWYLGCMTSKKEINELVNVLNLRLITDITKDRTHKQFKTLFDRESVFVFKCPKCTEAEIDTNKKHEEEMKLKDIAYEDIKQKLLLEYEKVKKVQRANTDKNKECTEKQQQLQNVKDEYEQYRNSVLELQQQNKELVHENDILKIRVVELERREEKDEMDLDEDVNRVITMKDAHELMEEYNSNVMKAISTKLMDITTELEARFSLEFKKLDEKICNNIIENGNEDGNIREMRRKRSKNENGASVMRNEQTNAARPHHFGDGNNISNGINGKKIINVPINQYTGVSNTNIDLTRTITTKTNLKPPVQINEDKDIYEIHVSRFDVSTTEEEINDHIMKNTQINSRDLFKVHKLISANKRKQDYTTFKITTLTKNLYEMIKEEQIWAPNFEAREYMKTNKRNELNENGNYRQNREKTYNRPYEYNKYKNYNRGYDMRKRVINRQNEQYSIQNTPRMTQNINKTPNNIQNRNIQNGQQNIQQNIQNGTPRNNVHNLMKQGVHPIIQYQQPQRLYYQIPQMYNTQQQNFTMPQQRQMTMRYQ